MTGVATDTINDHTIAGNQVWSKVVAYKTTVNFTTTDEYEGSIPSLVTKQIKYINYEYRIKRVH